MVRAGLRPVSSAIALLFLLAGCSTGAEGGTSPGPKTSTEPPSQGAELPCGRLGGTRAQLTIPVGATTGGPRIDEPERCGAEYYIRVHGTGRRRIDFTHPPASQRGQFAPCDTPEADPNACPKVSIDAFSWSVLTALRARFASNMLAVDAIGLGACAVVQAPLEKWNISSRIHDWRFADEAVRVVDAELRRWNIADDYGLSVTPFTCAVPE